MDNITEIIFGIAVVAVVFLAVFYFERKSRENKRKNGSAGNRGCSIAFYIFMALLLAGVTTAYIMYKTSSN